MNARIASGHDLRSAQLRDLRLLDPQLSTSYPSAILARDSALVLNLEFIKVMISVVHSSTSRILDASAALKPESWSCGGGGKDIIGEVWLNT